MSIEVIYGTCEVDLFDGPGPNHRTYQADGHWLTGVDSLDCETFCDEGCAEERLVEAGYQEADDSTAWWIRHPDGLYSDATLYNDVEFRDEMAPYRCDTCNTLLYDAPGDE
jgi:(2Fe-2S) ferredoxin